MAGRLSVVLTAVGLTLVAASAVAPRVLSNEHAAEQLREAAGQYQQAGHRGHLTHDKGPSRADELLSPDAPAQTRGEILMTARNDYLRRRAALDGAERHSRRVVLALRYAGVLVALTGVVLHFRARPGR